MANPLLEFQLYPSGQIIVFNANNVEAIVRASDQSATMWAGGESFEVTGVLDAVVHAIKLKIS
jgi:hypothetical protein